MEVIFSVFIMLFVMAVFFCCALAAHRHREHLRLLHQWLTVDGYAIEDTDAGEPRRVGQCANPKFIFCLLIIFAIVSFVAMEIWGMDGTGNFVVGSMFGFLLLIALYVNKNWLPLMVPRNPSVRIAYFSIVLISVVVLLAIGRATCTIGCPSPPPPTAPPPPHNDYWAQQVFPNRTVIGSAFSVSIPTADPQNVDHLKDAIKAKWDANYDTKLNALTLIIYKPGEDKAVTDPEQPLQSNTSKKPYQFELPTK